MKTHTKTATAPTVAAENTRPDFNIGATMIQGSYYLRVKPLSRESTRSPTNDSVILRVMKHNLREIQAEIGIREGSHIDPTRCHLNRVLRGRGTAALAHQEAKTILNDGGVKEIRRNASMGIELVISLGSGLLIDYEAFFNDCTNWSMHYFAVPILSAVVHNDESCPHCHVVLLPIREGKLSASKLLGGMAATFAMMADFYEKVGKKYGLTQQASEKTGKRLSKVIQRKMQDLIFNALQPDSAWNDLMLWALVMGDHEKVLELLGIPMPKGDFVEAMIQTGRQEKPIGHRRKSPIGHSIMPELSDSKWIKPDESQGENESPMSLYRSFIPEDVLSPDSTSIQSTESSIHREVIEPLAAEDEQVHEKYHRESDSELLACNFDDRTGGFVKPSVKASKKQAIQKEVESWLEGEGLHVVCD